MGRTDSHEDRQNDRLQSLDKPLSSHRKSPKIKMEKEILRGSVKREPDIKQRFEFGRKFFHTHEDFLK